MSKTTLGTLTTAQAAADMVTRVRTALETKHNFFSPSMFGNANEWATACAADVGSSSFTFFACYPSMVALKNISDGLVYQVARDTATSSYAQHKAQFDTLNTAGKTYIADYFYYDTPAVFVTKAYTPLHPNSGIFAGTPTDLTTSADPQFPSSIVGSSSADLADLTSTGVNYSCHHIGLDGTGRAKLIGVNY